MSTCISKPSQETYQCICDPSGKTSGQNCEIDQFCQENLCQNSSTCTKSKCICQLGYYGQFCEFEDFCMSNTKSQMSNQANIICQNNGDCQNGVAGPIMVEQKVFSPLKNSFFFEKS